MKSLSLTFLYAIGSLLPAEGHCPFCSQALFTVPTLFDVASSLPLVVEFLVPVFRPFPGLFTLAWMLDSYIQGTR